MTRISAVLLDLDGTLLRGRTAISGAARALERIRNSGTRVFFLTNASTNTRKSTVEKLEAAGIPAKEGEVFSSATMIADYIAAKYPGSTVFCISEGGMQDELLEKGIKVVRDGHADIVAVGLDRQLTYEKLARAFRAIRRGAVFIASNEDVMFPVEGGFLPGAGAIVAALEKCTGETPLLLGKPNRYGVELLLRGKGLKKSEALIVGDVIETDVLTGKNAGIRSALVLTGVSKKGDVKKLKKGGRPDFVLKSIAALPELLSKINRA
jgi:4-nitrophenyl phosphatase